MNDQQKEPANPVPIQDDRPATMHDQTMPTAPAAGEKKDRLDHSTTILFQLVAGSHTLARQFGIRTTGGKIVIDDRERPWLARQRNGSLSFDPWKYSLLLQSATSPAERQMTLFCLNLWDPPAVRHADDWHFDIFQAAALLDEENLAAVFTILCSKVRP